MYLLITCPRQVMILEDSIFVSVMLHGEVSALSSPETRSEGYFDVSADTYADRTGAMQKLFNQSANAVSQPLLFGQIQTDVANRRFDENYGLAATQSLKNKDIPEGGAKGTILPSCVAVRSKSILWFNAHHLLDSTRIPEYALRN